MCPLKSLATMLCGNALHHIHLLLHARRGTMKFHQQHGALTQRQLGVRIHHPNRVGIEQFAAGNRYTQLNDLDGGVHCIGQACERAGGRHHGFRQRVELDGYLSHDAEGAFAANQQAGEVVAGGGLLRAGAGADHTP